VVPTAVVANGSQSTSQQQQHVNLNQVYTSYLYSNKSQPSQLDLLVKNSLDILEVTDLVLLASNEQSQPPVDNKKYLYDLCVRYLPMVCPQPIHNKLSRILYRLVDHNHDDYLNIRDTMQMQLIVNTLRQNQNGGDQIDFEAYLKILFIIKLIIVNRPLNLIKYFSNENLNLMEILNDLFWSCLYDTYDRCMAAPIIPCIGNDTLFGHSNSSNMFNNMSQVVELLIEVTHYYLLYYSATTTTTTTAEASRHHHQSDTATSRLYAEYTAYFARFLLANDINICFLARKCLVYLLKAKKMRKAMENQKGGDIPPPPPSHSDTLSSSGATAVDEQLRLLPEQASKPMDLNIELMMDADEDELIELALALSLNDQPRCLYCFLCVNCIQLST
jgi:hypothetical protein